MMIASHRLVGLPKELYLSAVSCQYAANGERRTLTVPLLKAESVFFFEIELIISIDTTERNQVAEMSATNLNSPDFPYRTRRTVKPDSMDPSREIAGDLLLEILEDAHWAPSHGLTLPWRFHVFTGEGRNRLADALQTLYDQVTPTTEVQAKKRAKLQANSKQAQAVIAVVAHLEAGGKVSKLDELCSTACAVQNLLLSAHQRGLGSFWATPPAACSQEFVAWLGLDSTYCSLGLVFLGYAKEGSEPKSNRVPLEERVTFHSH
jgi:nitroreductase